MTHSEQATADARKTQIQIEINSQKIDIDKSVFVKTEEDRKALKKAKLLVGTVSGLRDDCIRAIISSSPNFGSLSFKTF
jgi:electron transfer flavoprotein alpha subunit